MVSRAYLITVAQMILVIVGNHEAYCQEENYQLTTKEAVVGETVTLECNLQDPIDSLKWEFFYKNGQNNLIQMMDGNIPAGKYIDRISLKSPNRYDLTISELSKNDSGEYLCRDKLHSRKNLVKIKLIVLETPPVCISYLKEVVTENSCGMHPDDLTLVCRVKYYGNTHPMLKWNGVVDDGKNNYFTKIDVSNTIITKPRWNQNTFSCQTSLYPHPCFVVVRNLYAFNTTKVTSLQAPQLVTCLANSSQSCQYSWWFEETKISDDAQLEFTTKSFTGEYRCTALCNIGNSICTLHPQTVYYESRPEGEATIASNQTVIVGLIVFVIILLIIIVIFCSPLKSKLCKKFDRCLKRKYRKLANDEKEYPERKKDQTLDFDTSKTPKLVHNIKGNRNEIKNEGESKKESIKGLTVLDKKIYIVRFSQSYIEVYSADKYTNEEKIDLPQLKQAADLVSCPIKKCLYISDRDRNIILKLFVEARVTKLWSTTTTPDGMYVTKATNLLVVCPKEYKIKKYQSDGTLLFETRLDKSVENMRHVIVIEKHYLVCYGNSMDPDAKIHGLFLVNPINGKIAGKCHLDLQYNDGNQDDWWPLRLARTKNGSILVLDTKFKKIVLLDSKTLAEKKNLIANLPHKPSRMFLDEDNKRLYLGENLGGCDILIYELFGHVDELNKLGSPVSQVSQTESI